MMRDIRLRGGAQVDLVETARNLLEQRLEQRPERGSAIEAALLLPRRVAARERDEAHDIIAVYRHPAIHIGFGKPEPGMQHDIAPDPGIGKAHGDIGERRVRHAEGPARSVGADQREGATLDQAFEETVYHGHALFLSMENGSRAV